MRRRRRALVLFAGAAICILFTVAIAARLENKVTAGYGPMRPALVASRQLAEGQVLSAADVSTLLTVRRIPGVFVPPETLSDSSAAIGMRLAADLSPGSYLQKGFLESADPGGGPFGQARGRRPVEVSVAGAGALTLGADLGVGAMSVDVVISGQPGLGRGSTEVVARGVPLVRLARPASPGEGWKATVAVSGDQALRLIAAESAGRVIRLLPLRIASG